MRVALFQLISKRFTVYYYPGQRIQNNSALTVHILHSLGSISASRHFTGAHICQLNHNTVRI